MQQMNVDEEYLSDEESLSETSEEEDEQEI